MRYTCQYDPYAATYNYLLDNVSKLLNLSNEDKENYNSIIGPNLDIVQRYLPTIRDVKRFLNLFINRFAMLREDVETYEEAVRKQVALAEQARLKEQAAKEQ